MYIGNDLGNYFISKENCTTCPFPIGPLGFIFYSLSLVHNFSLESCVAVEADHFR